MTVPYNLKEVLSGIVAGTFGISNQTLRLICVGLIPTSTQVQIQITDLDRPSTCLMINEFC